MPPRPRILLLTAYYHPFHGGVETHARDLAGYLRAEGFEVIVVTKQAPEDRARQTTIDGVPVYRTWPPGPRTALRKWLMIPFAWWRMVRLRDRYDVIYCPGYQGIGLAALAAGRVTGRPVVLRSGNIGVLAGSQMDAPLSRLGIRGAGRPAGWLKALLRRIYLRADAFACNSREIEREALAVGVPRAKVHYLPNAVDPERFRPAAPGEREAVRREQQWPEATRLCLYVGRLSTEKGVLDLLEAWAALDAADATLVLVGPDMPRSPLDAGPAARAFIRERGLANVVLHGRSEDVPRLLRAADVYVQPSHYEAFSNAVLEAMATGLPIVASRVSGMLDCLTDEATALLAEPQRPADLARQLRRVLADAALGARLGAAARAAVIDRFSRAVIFDGFARLFTEVHAAARRA